MDLKELLGELERLGENNDATVKEKELKYLNITRETGEFLAVLIKAGSVRQVLEVGTSNGYSTLWLASALPEDGHVTTLEVSSYKIEQASRNFKRANLDQKITVVQADAADYLSQGSMQFDLIFLDADRSRYIEFADQIIARIRPRGLLVCDNAVSHAPELEEFICFVKSTGDFTAVTVPIGKGEFVACKNA
jgi:predicted O-methyltransferase YrrM